MAADGTVLSEAPADVPRPDLAATAPESTASGYSLVVPLVAGETVDGVHLVAVTPQGTAAAVGASPPLAAGTRVRYSGSREASVGAASSGLIDAAAVGDVPGDRRLGRVEVPEGAILDHDWLEVSRDGDPVGGLFQLTNMPGDTGADAIFRRWARASCSRPSTARPTASSSRRRAARSGTASRGVRSTSSRPCPTTCRRPCPTTCASPYGGRGRRLCRG